MEIIKKKPSGNWVQEYNNCNEKSLDGLNSRSDMIEEIISKLEIIQSY